MTDHEAQEELQDGVEGMLSSLTTFLQHANVQAKLGSMEARDAWMQHRPELYAMALRLREVAETTPAATGEARLQLHLAVREVKEAWADTQPRLTAVMDRLGMAKDAMHTAREELAASGTDAREALEVLLSEEDEATQKDALKRIRERGKVHLKQVGEQLESADAAAEGAAVMAVRAVRSGIQDMMARLSATPPNRET